MQLRITIAMLEIRNRKTLQSKVNICKSDVKIGDYADSLGWGLGLMLLNLVNYCCNITHVQLLGDIVIHQTYYN